MELQYLKLAQIGNFPHNIEFIGKSVAGQVQDDSTFPAESDQRGTIAANDKITKGYAQLYLDNRNFKWAGMAAFASNSVGDGMDSSTL